MRLSFFPLVLAVVTTVSTPTAHAQGSQLEPRTDAAVLAASDDWLAAERRGDVASLDRRLMPEYRDILPDGHVHLRAAPIAHAANLKDPSTVPAKQLALVSTHNSAPAADGPEIQIDDVARFYKVYDAAGGHPTADQLQHEYLDPGSEGLHHLAKVRNVTGVTIAAAMEKRPDIYSDARRCMDVLPRVRERLGLAFHKLVQLYPEAKLTPVTIAVGRGKPVAIGGPGGEGTQIGLEALCAVAWLNPNVEDRFVHVIAHEFAHVQQSAALADNEHPTVLGLSLAEGSAELVAELTSGDVGYSQFKTSTKGHEKEIESAFAAAEDSTDLSSWFNNSTIEKPGDLGYWVGYRIAKAYYEHASDKRVALREILQMTDPKAFLAKSGWYPGITLQ